MDDRPIPVARRPVVRACESSRHQRQLLARAYRQVFPQVRQPLGGGDIAAGPCGVLTPHRAAARVAARA